MRKVLILANSSVGLYGFRNELVLELLKKYKVFISVPDEMSAKELQEEGCEIVYTPINRRGVNPVEDLKLFLIYKKLLKRIEPDLVLTYTIKPNIYGGYVCKQKKTPYISTITGLGTSFQKEGFLKKLIVKMYRIGLAKADCVFFQNANNQEIFREYKIDGKKSVLVNGSGVNLDKYPLQEYPIEGKTHFLFVGRVMKEKGVEEFLEAAQLLHDDSTDFWILGYCDEDYQNKLEEYERNGIIRYEGFQTDMEHYYTEASVVVLPTYHEGMSNVLMEASATGRPVIATNISGCKEIFEDGLTGFGCEPKNSESLIAAMKQFLALNIEERAEMGRNARKKIEREFDRRQVTDVYIKEINRILNS